MKPGTTGMIAALAMLAPLMSAPAQAREGSGGLVEMIRLGKEIFNIVVQNRPVVDTHLDSVSVVPSGAREGAMGLTGWQERSSDRIQSVMKNDLGLEIVRFTYRLTFQSNGAYRGHGQYLANVTIVPERLDVDGIGVKVDVAAQVQQPVNAGTEQEPVASLKVNVVMRTERLTGVDLRTDEIRIDGKGNIWVKQRSGAPENFPRVRLEWL